MDLERLQNTYQNISRDEMERMWRFGYFESSMKRLNGIREKMKIRGREHVVSVPLVQVLSVHVILDKVDENKPLAIYGRIYGEYDHIVYQNERCTHNVYNRGCDEPETIGQNGNLTLTGPDASSLKFDVCMPLHETTIVVDLWDANQKVAFSQGSFLVEEMAENDYEQVKQKVVPGMSGYVIVRYIAMPFATLCNATIQFFHKGFKKEDSCCVVNLNGKITIRYDNTYGNYSSEEYIIFEKSNFEFEPVEVDSRTRLRQSRYWIAVPAYSSLVIDFDLWEFDTKRNILKETVKFPTQRWYDGYQHIFTVDDLAIDVNVSYCQLYSRKVCEEENNHESAVMHSDDESSSDTSIPWNPFPHGFELTGAALVEFYSIFIGHEKHKPLRIFGVIEAQCGAHTFDIFRRQESNALELLEDETTLPILDGNRKYDPHHSLKVMFDLKDVDGRVFIKGFVKWHQDQLDDPWWDQQLCSVIPVKQKPCLLQLLFDVYSRFGKSVKRAIHRHVPILLRALGASYSEPFRIIPDPPTGSENLIVSGTAHTGPALTPAEVLVAIHDIVPEKEGIAFKKVMNTCLACFEERTVFTQHVLAKALNQMVSIFHYRRHIPPHHHHYFAPFQADRTLLPLLFMRTSFRQ